MSCMSIEEKRNKFAGGGAGGPQLPLVLSEKVRRTWKRERKGSRSRRRHRRSTARPRRARLSHRDTIYIANTQRDWRHDSIDRLIDPCFHRSKDSPTREVEQAPLIPFNSSVYRFPALFLTSNFENGLKCFGPLRKRIRDTHFAELKWVY